MSSSKAKVAKVGIQFSKETGGAYADVREVIESELARIRKELASKTNGNGMIRQPDQDAKNGNQSSK